MGVSRGQDLLLTPAEAYYLVVERRVLCCRGAECSGACRGLISQILNEARDLPGNPAILDLYHRLRKTGYVIREVIPGGTADGTAQCQEEGLLTRSAESMVCGYHWRVFTPDRSLKGRVLAEKTRASVLIRFLPQSESSPLVLFESDIGNRLEVDVGVKVVTGVYTRSSVAFLQSEVFQWRGGLGRSEKLGKRGSGEATPLLPDGAGNVK